MEAVISCTGSYSPWRIHFCSKEKVKAFCFLTEGGGVHEFSAVKLETKVKRNQWHNSLLKRAPKAVWGYNLRNIFQSASTSFPASPEDENIHKQSGVSHVDVKFVLQRQCNFGEQFCVIGEDPLLGAWDPSAAVPLQWSENHVWTTELKVPVGKSYEYKFVLIGQLGEVEWQPGSNRILKVASDTSSTLVVLEPWELHELIREVNSFGDVTKVEVQEAKDGANEQEQNGEELAFKTEDTIGTAPGSKIESSVSLEELHEEVALFEIEEAITKRGGPSREVDAKSDHGDYGLKLKIASVDYVVVDVKDAEFGALTAGLGDATKSFTSAGSVKPPLGTDEALSLNTTFLRKSEVEMNAILKIKQQLLAIGSHNRAGCIF